MRKILSAGSLVLMFLSLAPLRSEAQDAQDAKPPIVEQTPEKAPLNRYDIPGIYLPERPVSECSKHEDCDDKIECSKDECIKVYLDDLNPAEKPIGTCKNTFPKGCLPPPVRDKCAIRYAGDEAAIKCCRTHISRNEPVVDANGKLIPCDGPETCPTCPDCKPPVVDCNSPFIVINPEFKECCESHGGNLFFMMAPNNCVKKASDCNIIVNVGGDVNGQMNVCCNVLNNTGTITDSTVSQACNNVTGGGTGGGTTTGGTPTTPEGSSPAALSCTVAGVGAPVDGKFSVTYTAPSSVGAVASAMLTQVAGPQIRVDGATDDGGFGVDLTTPKSMATKSISDLSNPPPFSVTSPTPKSMLGNWEAPFQVKVSLHDLAGTELASTPCQSTFKLEAKGSGSGCGLRVDGIHSVRANAVFFLLLLLGGAPWLFRRHKNDSSGS